MAKRLAHLALLICCLLLSLPHPAFASLEPVKWTPVSIPVQGKPGWVLAAGSDIRSLAISATGVLYAGANPPGAGQTLFKSTDGGYTWSACGNITEDLVSIAVAPDNPNLVACASLSKAYRSTDGGSTFALLPPSPGGAGGGNIQITSVTITAKGAGTITAVGTMDSDAAEYGGVYILDDTLPPVWADTAIGSYDVYAVAFSPAYAQDSQLVAVITDDTSSFVASRIADNPWAVQISTAELRQDNALAISVDTAASLAFPSGYSASTGTLYAGIDAGAENGDVYRIDLAPAPTLSTAADLDAGAAFGLANIDFASVAVSGMGATAKIMAGAAAGAQVYISIDGGSNWTRSAKPPTGSTSTLVLMGSSGTAYAATTGAESALSSSTDDGISWNQVSMVDTAINNIIDIAVSPAYAQDDTLFMLTFGGKHSLWRGAGGRWQRVFCGALPGIGTLDRVKLSSASASTVFLAGSSLGSPGIWKSTDRGQRFIFTAVADPTGAAVSIDTWAVIDDNSLIIGSYDDISACLLQTSGGAYTRSVVGTAPLNSIQLSPDYAQDKTLLIGTSSGGVFLSDDGGVTFATLPPGAASPPLSGNINLAFDPAYSGNRTLYAASDTAGKGLYRFVVGKSGSWEKIDGALPAGATMKQIVVTDEALYAANSKPGGGIERSLNPSSPLPPGFETVTRGLESSSTLSGLWVCKGQLWSIDTMNNALLTYMDTLTQPPVPESPPDNAPGTEIRNLVIDWIAMPGATSYRWQADCDGDFSSVPAGFEDATEAASARLPALEPGTTYHWRVRAEEPVLSPWSPRRSFTTTLGSGASAPRTTLPEAGAKATGLKPLFQWETVVGASGYELLVATDSSFANPIVARLGEYSLPANVWQCQTALSPGTLYYWKVRAWNPKTRSAWSPLSAFTTGEAAPSPPPAPPAVPPPCPVAPEAGARGLPQNPIFQWEAIASASAYELLVAAEPSFANPVIARLGDYSIPTNAWQCPNTLDCGKTYYWKVRAVSSETSGAWSPVNAFTTEPPPTPQISAPSPAPAPAPTPATLPPIVITIAAPPASGIPEWAGDWAKMVAYAGLTLAGVILAILSVLVLLVVKLRKP